MRVRSCGSRPCASCLAPSPVGEAITGAWNTVTCDLTATGTHEVYVKVTGGAGEVLRLASLRFVPGAQSSKGGRFRSSSLTLSLAIRCSSRGHPVQNLRRVLAARAASSGPQGRGMSELWRLTSLRYVRSPEA